MRRAARTDQNHTEIIKGLRKIGATVQSLHAVGKGCPDILVGYRGKNFLFEIKVEKGSLTNEQIKWHDDWNGMAYVVRSIDEAVCLCTGQALPPKQYEQFALVLDKIVPPKSKKEDLVLEEQFDEGQVKKEQEVFGNYLAASLNPPSTSRKR